jgi:argininosuccinate lyase
LDSSAWNLNVSLDIDKRLAFEDVRGSMAWANGLEQAQILSAEENHSIQAGLAQIMEEFRNNSFLFKENDEDIHTAVERRLAEIIGITGKKLHTGRSRNDQVATDFRLWLLHQLPALEAAILELQNVLLERSISDTGIILPGYTHLQRAQPILLSHWWLSYFWPLQRDRQKLGYVKQITSILPLGCGALAGTAFNVNREYLAKELGFEKPAPNSLDAISDRDFAIEFLSWASLLGVHLSRLAESLVLYSTSEFSYFILADAYSTGSSLMPQKKNPDIFELTRGKSGVYISNLMGLLTTLKGLPSIYDKDLQEDKHYVFSSCDTVLLTLPALAGAIKTLTANPQKMFKNIDSSMLATDIADFLVKNGLPFREAHHVVGQIVQYSVKNQHPIDTLSKEKLLEFHPLFTNFTPEILSPQQSIANRSCTGGTSLDAVKVQIEDAQEQIQQRFS